MSDFILAIDIGGGSLRGGLVRPDGRQLRAASAPLSAVEPQSGWCEIDPERWWGALCDVAQRLIRALPRSGRVAGMCICGLTRTQVLLDRNGRTLRPAMLFRDARAADVARDIARHVPIENPTDAITAFHPLARLAWIARHEPRVFAAVDRVLEPKDYLNLRLTGIAARDSVAASRQDASVAVPRALPAEIQRGIELLASPVIAPWRQLGVVQSAGRPLHALHGVPVFAGAMDAWASAVGAGAARPGQAYDVAGTSEVVGLVTQCPVAVPGLVSLDWSETAHQVGGPTQAGADCLQWCHETFRVRGSLAAAVERAGAERIRDDAPLFLPFLAGERTPVWRSDVRGAFHLLRRDCAPDDFLRSVMEGVALAVNDILGRAIAGSHERAAEVRVAGGGARSDAWCQMKADVLGLPVLRSAVAETGLIGAAVAAAVGLGFHGTIAEAAAAMVVDDRRFDPKPDRTTFFAVRMARYQRAKAAALGFADASPTAEACTA